MSVKNPTNTKFKDQFAAWVKANNLPGGAKRVTNDPMEATFVGIHMWKQAVEKAKSTDVDKVRVAMIGQTVAAPSGFTLTMDGNHHLHKPVMIGEIRGDGSSTSCGRPRRPCAHSRGARSSRATRASRTSSARSRRSCAGSAALAS
jgi:ABC-type branched-subunit amino acid transport system substrate-binding protein